MSEYPTRCCYGYQPQNVFRLWNYIDNKSKKGISIHSYNLFSSFSLKKKKRYSGPVDLSTIDHLNNAVIRNKHQVLSILFIKSSLNNAEILLQQRT